MMRPIPDTVTDRRYKVMFTPVGWHVVDTTGKAGAPVAEFGLGPDEYKRAREKADELDRLDAFKPLAIAMAKSGAAKRV